MSDPLAASNNAADGLEFMNELLKNSSDIDENVPEGMSQFMLTVFDKSKKLAVPILLFCGATAATVATAATGGISAAAVLGICSGSIGVLNKMREFYKFNKDSETKKNTEKTDDQMTNMIGGLAQELSEEIKNVETSIQSYLKDMNLSLEYITRKLDRLILHHDKNIEAAFSNVQSKLKDKCFNSASDFLNQLNFAEMLLQSHVGIEKAEEMIMEELSENGKEGALQMYYYLLQLRQKLELLIQMKHFLTDMKNSSNSKLENYFKSYSRDFLRDLEGYWEIMKKVFPDKMKIPTVLVLGKCGTGKSTLCNIMAGLAEDADEEVDGFNTSSETVACTQQTTLKEFCYFGDPTRPVRIIDTPGFDDPNKNHDAEIITNFVEVLKNEVHGVNLILLALNGQSPRLEGSLLAMLKIIRGMFTPEIWDTLAVVFTRVPMDNANVKRRSKKNPMYDSQVADGFLKTIEEKFNPPSNSKKIEYFYMDALYNNDIEEERIVLEESKEKLWKMLYGNPLFNTNRVEEVMTEYAALKEEVKKKDSELSKANIMIREFEQNELKRIKRENEETTTPVNGMTFMKFRDQNVLKRYRNIYDYSMFITHICNTARKPLESLETFSETIKTIEKDEDRKIGFVADQCDLLCSENLMHRIPRKHPADKVSQMVYILEISNYTGHFLEDFEMIMAEGNKQPLAVWDADDNKSTLANPSFLNIPETFVIPPYTKERLIFRNSGQRNKTKLEGIITMNIGGKTYASEPKKKMMVNFKIDGATYVTGTSSFWVGFPDISKSAMEIKNTLKKKQEDDSFARMNFPSEDVKRGYIPSQSLRYPTEPVPGGFNLTCYFGNANHSRSIVILSKTPDSKTPEPTRL